MIGRNSTLARLSCVGVPVEPDSGAAAAPTLASVEFMGPQGVENSEKDTARGQKRAWQSETASGAPPYPFISLRHFGSLNFIEISA